MRLVPALIATLLTLTACGSDAADSGDDTSALASNERLVAADDYGKRWPLKVDEGVLRCEDGEAVVFVVNGTAYAVNGMADTWNLGEPIEPIWKKNPDVPGARVDISPLIDDGLALC